MEKSEHIVLLFASINILEVTLIARKAVKMFKLSQEVFLNQKQEELFPNSSPFEPFQREEHRTTQTAFSMWLLFVVTALWLVRNINTSDLDLILRDKGWSSLVKILDGLLSFFIQYEI